MEQEVESGFSALRETVNKYLNHSAYAVVNLTELFSGLMARNKLQSLQCLVDTTQDLDSDDEF